MKQHGRETNKRVAVVGCKHTTLELIVGLEQRGFTVDHGITISPEQGAGITKWPAISTCARFSPKRASPSRSPNSTA